MRISVEPSRRPGDHAFHHRVRVRFAETDAMGIVHHSRYLPLLEEARVAYLRKIGHPYHELRQADGDIAVVEAHVAYLVPLCFDEVVDIYLSVADADRATFQMAYVLTVDDEVRATAVTVHACITTSGRPTRLPGWLREIGDPPTIAVGGLSVTLAPSEGGRVAQVVADGVALLVDRGAGPTPDSALSWGSYPMVPWAGRIRAGRFSFADGDGPAASHQLPVNFGAHAIHGVGVFQPWRVAEHSPTSIALALDMPADERWPFGGDAVQRISVARSDAGYVLKFELTATAGDRAMPVSLGWHPWFRKPLALEFAPRAMYRRDADHVAVDELVEVPTGPWDDCFVNDAPVTLTIDGVTVTLRSECTDWVVYDEPTHATCVEPQTAPPDAFTIRPHRLAPRESLTARCEWEIHTSPATVTR